jgi:hypothetical protein
MDVDGSDHVFLKGLGFALGLALLPSFPSTLDELVPGINPDLNPTIHITLAMKNASGHSPAASLRGSILLKPTSSWSISVSRTPRKSLTF